MDALILADGDVASRGRARRRWPGWDDGDRAGRRRRRRRAPRRARSGSPIDLLGRRRRFDRAEAELGRARRGRHPARTVAARQGRIGHGARDPGGHRARRTTGSSIVGALGGPRIDHALANIGLLAHPDLAGRAAVDPRPVERIRAGPRPGSTADAVGAARRARSATSSRCCRRATASRASRPRACATRSATSRCPPGRPAACRTSGSRDRRRGHASGAGCCSSSRSPATLSP